jgi:hypothetical protein
MLKFEGSMSSQNRAATDRVDAEDINGVWYVPLCGRRDRRFGCS